MPTRLRVNPVTAYMRLADVKVKIVRLDGPPFSWMKGSNYYYKFILTNIEGKRLTAHASSFRSMRNHKKERIFILIIDTLRSFDSSFRRHKTKMDHYDKYCEKLRKKFLRFVGGEEEYNLLLYGDRTS